MRLHEGSWESLPEAKAEARAGPCHTQGHSAGGKRLEVPGILAHKEEARNAGLELVTAKLCPST